MSPWVAVSSGSRSLDGKGTPEPVRAPGFVVLQGGGYSTVFNIVHLPCFLPSSRFIHPPDLSFLMVLYVEVSLTLSFSEMKA